MGQLRIDHVCDFPGVKGELVCFVAIEAVPGTTSLMTETLCKIHWQNTDGMS